MSKEKKDMGNYLSYYDRKMQQHSVGRKLELYYEELKKNYQEYTQKLSSENLLRSMEQLVILDAKLILLVHFIEESPKDKTEDDIIFKVENDSGSYYEKTYGVSTSEVVAQSILFMNSIEHLA